MLDTIGDLDPELSSSQVIDATGNVVCLSEENKKFQFYKVCMRNSKGGRSKELNSNRLDMKGSCFLVKLIWIEQRPS